MIVDKKFCMSSYLMYRYITDPEKLFTEKVFPYKPNLTFEREKIQTSINLHRTLKRKVEDATRDGKAALALSGGIDSAILAKFMPRGSTAYTFKCVVPGLKVIDESLVAAQYAKECGLKHKIIEIYWDDYEKYTNVLMKHKGAPIHSIEVQIYKAAITAQKDGFERLIYGESADCVFGGLSDLLSKEWAVGDFIDRYSFVKPYKALKTPELVLDPIIKHEKCGYIDPHEFLSTEFYPESVGSYINASAAAKFGLVIPYAECTMDCPIDYMRIRNGENKYLVREIFNSLYINYEIPPKTPMPRPMNEWFKAWRGPIRPEFWPHCVNNMTGDQKWLVWCLEKFLDSIEEL